jgi:hypothetical protein
VLLGVMLFLNAFALNVVVLAAFTAPLYAGELRVGSLPSVVKWISAPVVAVEIVTVCAWVKVPGAGENDGSATCIS